MYFIKFSGLILILIGLNGCDGIFRSDSDEVKIRIENGSDYDMKYLSVSFPDGEIVFGDIKSGEMSIYKDIERAYRYAYVETEIQGKKAVLQPIDYVGESYLSPGLYTYILNVEESDVTGSEGSIFMNLTLRED
jgi:hypothetical protein